MVDLIGIEKIVAQMKDVLIGKTIESFTLLQKKALNASEEAFIDRAKGATITDVYRRGSWLVTTLDNNENILLSFTLGSDIFYFENNDIKEQKYKPNIKVFFNDNSGYVVRFWWFEKFFIVKTDEIEEVINATEGAVDPLDEAFTLDYFMTLLGGKKKQIKAFLMSQKKVSSLSGMYMHDILFAAKLHPLKNISDMSETDIEQLYRSILSYIKTCRSKMDFFGERGAFDGGDFIIAYKDNNEPCPICSTPISYIKTGSTSTYVCSTCQQLH